MKESSDGRLRDAENAADLRMLEAFDVLEDEDPPLLAGEPGDGPAEAQPDVRTRFGAAAGRTGDVPARVSVGGRRGHRLRPFQEKKPPDALFPQ